ncbi:MAG: immunoglobulin-like domain-containing protein [Mycoplasmatales bacterium]
MKNKKFIFGIVTIFVLSLVAFIPNQASAMTNDEEVKILGDVTATTPKSTGLSDQELINLFNVNSNNGSKVKVFSDYIDYSKPGSYQVIFYSANAQNPYDGALYSFLTVTDTPVELNVGSTHETIMQNETVDYKELFAVEAHEITKGDLTDQVIVDDSNVNLNIAGDYPITFSVTDSQGNTTSKDVTLTVKSGKPTITGDYYTKLDASIINLTDDLLIELFNVQSSEDKITVNQEGVDYSKPGEYHISFTATNEYGTTTLQSALIIQ